MENEIKYIVTTRCMTYNHASFIEDTLNGFIMQKTDFPICFVIVDDASTDGEPEVIAQWINDNLVIEDSLGLWKDMPYGKLVIAKAANKQDMTFVFLLLSENHYQTGRSTLKIQYISKWCNNSKYLALCEGDDYWIDSMKLQKQVDYLNSHKDCVLCGTNGLVLWDDGVLPPQYFNSIFKSRVLTANDIIGKWALPTPSLVYRRELSNDWPEWTKTIYSGDQTLLLLSLYRGSVYCLKDLTCVYRKNQSNNTSMSNLLKMKPLSFQSEQHLKLYQAFDEYTNHTYQPLIGTVINSLEKKKKELELRASFYELYRCSIVQAFIKYPLIFFKLGIEKMRGNLKTKINQV